MCCTHLLGFIRLFELALVILVQLQSHPVGSVVETFAIDGLGGEPHKSA